MQLISHRGNVTGPDEERENHPDYITEALKCGYDVEIDVHFDNCNYYLGHDNPQYIIDEQFLQTSGIWCHGKTIGTIHQLLKNSEIHSFFHNTDEVTITSRGYLWTFPGKNLTPMSVCVMPEKHNYHKSHLTIPYGICSDYIQNY